jgi:hypothetical protein
VEEAILTVHAMKITVIQTEEIPRILMEITEAEAVTEGLPQMQ